MNLTSPGDSRVLIESVIETLQQGETLLTETSDETYTRKVPIAFNASIGGHYRHCLDHFRSLLDSAMDGDLNYDHRERDTLVEKDRYAALNATRELREGFEGLDPAFLLRPLSVTCKETIEDIEDARIIERAKAAHGNKPRIPWSQVKKDLKLD